MSGPIEVTDHAVIRWFERAAGVNVDAVRNMLQHQVGVQHRVLQQDGRYPLKSAHDDTAHHAVVSDGRVVTII